MYASSYEAATKSKFIPNKDYFLKHQLFHLITPSLEEEMSISKKFQRSRMGVVLEEKVGTGGKVAMTFSKIDR